MSSLGIFDKETKTYKKVADLSKPAVIDSSMSDTSTNAVQNKVVKKYVDDRTSSVAWNNITGKPSTYPPSSHTHDDRYYTESEINTKLNNKANVFKYEFTDHDVYRCLGTATLRQEGDYLILHIYCGSGYNGNLYQDRTIDVHIRTSNGIAVNERYYDGYIESHLNRATNCNVYVVQNSSTSFTIWIGKLFYTGNSFYEVQLPNVDSWVPATDTSTTIPTNGVALIEKQIAYRDVATTSENGLMSKDMVSKLNGIAEGANRTTVDNAMSDSSTNPVQNNVVKSYVDGTQTGYYVGSNPPENKNILWIDSLHGGMVKYFASDTSKWHPVRAKGYDTPVDLIREGYWKYFLGPGITVGAISAIYDINTDKVTIIINNLNITSEAFTGPTDMVTFNMPMYNFGHNGSFNPVQYNGPSDIDLCLYLEYPDGVIKTGPPYGIYKPATISSIKFETRLNYPAYTY